MGQVIPAAGGVKESSLRLQQQKHLFQILRQLFLVIQQGAIQIGKNKTNGLFHSGPPLFFCQMDELEGGMGINGDGIQVAAADGTQQRKNFAVGGHAGAADPGVLQGGKGNADGAAIVIGIGQRAINTAAAWSIPRCAN